MSEDRAQLHEGGLLATVPNHLCACARVPVCNGVASSTGSNVRRDGKPYDRKRNEKGMREHHGDKGLGTLHLLASRIVLRSLRLVFLHVLACDFRCTSDGCQGETDQARLQRGEEKALVGVHLRRDPLDKPRRRGGRRDRPIHIFGWC